MAYADSMERLIQAFRESSTPVYVTEKVEILEYYHDTYLDEWKRHLVDDLHRLTGAKRSSLMRRFQGDRTMRRPRTAKARAEYAWLGQHLPPLRYDPPRGGYQIDFAGYVQISEECDDRDFSVVALGTQAYQLVNAPSFGGVMDLYFPAGLVSGACGPWSLEITPLV